MSNSLTASERQEVIANAQRLLGRLQAQQKKWQEATDLNAFDTHIYLKGKFNPEDEATYSNVAYVAPEFIPFGGLRNLMLLGLGNQIKDIKQTITEL